LHECIRCGSSHPAIICPENFDNYLVEYIKRRRMEGYRDEDLMRLELQVTHSVPAIGPNGSSTTAMPINMNSMNTMNNSTSYNNIMSNNMMGVNTLASIAAPGSQSANHHPMHIAAAAAAAAAIRGNVTGNPANAHQLAHQHAFHQLQQQQMQQQQYNAALQSPITNALMGALDPERATKRIRQDDPNFLGGLVGALPGSVNSLANMGNVGT
jgi:hypothetical protein